MNIVEGDKVLQMRATSSYKQFQQIDKTNIHIMKPLLLKNQSELIFKTSPQKSGSLLQTRSTIDKSRKKHAKLRFKRDLSTSAKETSLKFEFHRPSTALPN